MHMACISTILSYSSNGDSFIFYSKYFIIIDIGLIITPGAYKDVADIDSRKRFFYFGDVISLDDDSSVTKFTIYCSTIESTITVSFPNT